MKEFSIPMALVDYIPVVLFLLAILSLCKDLKHKNKVGTIVLFVGSMLVFAAGAIKATYKLLYAAKIGDFVWMSNQFFSNQALGFLIAGIGMTIVVASKKNEVKTNAFLPTMALVGMMVVGICAVDAGLCKLASQLKKKWLIPLIVVSFFCSMTMGYLSTKDFTQAYMNWVAQGLNVLGMALLFISTKQLHKAGLANL